VRLPRWLGRGRARSTPRFCRSSGWVRDRIWCGRRDDSAEAELALPRRSVCPRKDRSFCRDHSTVAELTLPRSLLRTGLDQEEKKAKACRNRPPYIPRSRRVGDARVEFGPPRAAASPSPRSGRYRALACACALRRSNARSGRLIARARGVRVTARCPFEAARVIRYVY